MPWHVVDTAALNMIIVCRATHHPNRFVRETCYFVIASVCETLKGSELEQIGQEVAVRLADGLSDNWSQVRQCVAMLNTRLCM